MCGIFGVVTKEGDLDSKLLSKTVKNLFLLSESRGKEAAGIAINSDDKIYIHKTPFSASKLINSRKYINIEKTYFRSKNLSSLAIMGHSRLVTNGYEQFNKNNQPVIKNRVIAIHNGIIVNNESLWIKYKQEIQETELDSELIPTILSKNLNEGLPIDESLKGLYDDIYGMTSIAVLFADYENLILATNNGSLYYIISNTQKSLIFASERYIINELFNENHFNNLYDISKIKQLKSNNFININLKEMSFSSRKLYEDVKTPLKLIKRINSLTIQEDNESRFDETYTNTSLEHKKAVVPAYLLEHSEHCKNRISNLKRCSNCLLPQSYPFIDFDFKGICNYCRNYEKIQFKGASQFIEMLNSFKSTDGRPDCLIPFSGGRDSSYTLHYVKKILGMNPIAFSYDWGMLTDLARRNQARMCGKLGVEHILISADIRKKRENIKKNVLAWLRRPHLGTIPLFMAGDKQYYYYSNLLMKQNELKLSILGENLLEPASFKTAFAGIKPNFKKNRAMLLSKNDKFKMLYFYGKQFFLNPAYLNNSIWDTLDAFKSYYVLDHKVVNFFGFCQWNENEINKTLKDEYDWETDPETNTTWRIGDGTAAFYNYIYYTVAGFTEYDTFRSNQIREGMIDRESALLKVNEENMPRWDSLKWYCNTIQIDFAETIDIINRISKKYNY